MFVQYDRSRNLLFSGERARLGESCEAELQPIPQLLAAQRLLRRGYEHGEVLKICLVMYGFGWAGRRGLVNRGQDSGDK